MTSGGETGHPMSVRIIGIDCATDPKKVGVAWGDYSAVASGRGHMAIEGVAERSSATAEQGWTEIVKRIGQFARDCDPVLLALDAPLGWPIAMGTSLVEHSAGSPLRVEPDRMFQRETDRLIEEKIGKKPLEVGANLIARTAHSALQRLDQIRVELDCATPLAWDRAQMAGSQAIEVYPAATLLAHGLSDAGYKGSKAKHRRRRERLTAQLAKNRLLGGITGDVRLRMEGTDHDLDAVVCCLAAADFLRGDVIRPEPDQLPVAKSEGWIWVKPRPDASKAARRR